MADSSSRLAEVLKNYVAAVAKVHGEHDVTEVNAVRSRLNDSIHLVISVTHVDKWYPKYVTTTLTFSEKQWPDNIQSYLREINEFLWPAYNLS